MIVLDKRQRNQGTYTSSAALDVPAGYTTVRLGALMDVADIEDAALQIPFAVEASFDAQALTWVPLFGGIWRGGVPDRHGVYHAPAFAYSTTSGWPLHYRATVSLPRRLPLGLDVTWS